jgi:metal-responsive CopG/Arc/MetJ family transcriptional regulator
MFSSKKKIALEPQLYERLEKMAEAAGYSSTDELITHLLEQATVEQEEQMNRAAAERQLRGLGYIE